jgi:hypothetical protein
VAVFSASIMVGRCKIDRDGNCKLMRGESGERRSDECIILVGFMRLYRENSILDTRLV